MPPKDNSFIDQFEQVTEMLYEQPVNGPDFQRAFERLEYAGNALVGEKALKLGEFAANMHSLVSLIPDAEVVPRTEVFDSYFAGKITTYAALMETKTATRKAKTTPKPKPTDTTQTRNDPPKY